MKFYLASKRNIIISLQLLFSCIIIAQELQTPCSVSFLELSHAQENFTERTIGDDASILTSTVGSVLSSPLNWEEKDLYNLGSFILISASSFLLDDEVRKVFQKNRNETLKKLEPIGYTYGAPHYAASASLLLYSSGVIFKNNWFRDTGLMLTESLAIIGIIQVPLRILFGRERPYTGSKNSSFKLLKGFGQDRASFISGHTAIAFGISNILAHQICHPIATVSLFGLAALTPLARLHADKHWFSDIIIGSALGMFISNAIIRIHDKSNSSNSNLSFSPTLNGIMFTYNF